MRKRKKKKKEGKREMREVVTSRQFGQTFLLRAIRLRGLGKQNLQSVEGEKKKKKKRHRRRRRRGRAIYERLDNTRGIRKKKKTNDIRVKHKAIPNLP